MKFMSVIGWLRFVCSNGLIVGVADTYYKSRHNRFMELSDIAAIIKDGIEATTNEKKLFQKWQKRTVSEDKLKKWTDDCLAKKWGVKAAVRIWHITRSGVDAEIADPFEKGKATEKLSLQETRCLDLFCLVTMFMLLVNRSHGLPRNVAMFRNNWNGNSRYLNCLHHFANNLVNLRGFPVAITEVFCYESPTYQSR